MLTFSSVLIFKEIQYRSKLVNMLFECHPAWIRVRRRVTRCLIQIQSVCIWHLTRYVLFKLNSYRCLNLSLFILMSECIIIVFIHAKIQHSSHRYNNSYLFTQICYKNKMFIDGISSEIPGLRYSINLAE